MRTQPAAPIDARLDAAHEPVAEEERQHVVAPAAFRLGHVDLPDVVEAEQAAQQLAIPGQRVQRRQEGHAGLGQWRCPPETSASAASQQAQLVTQDEAPAAHALDGHGHELAGGDQLLAQLLAGRGVGWVVRVAAGLDAVPQLPLPAFAEEAVGAIARQEAVTLLRTRIRAVGEQLGRVEALDEVEPAAVAARDARGR